MLDRDSPARRPEASQERRRSGLGRSPGDARFAQTGADQEQGEEPASTTLRSRGSSDWSVQSSSTRRADPRRRAPSRGIWSHPTWSATTPTDEPRRRLLAPGGKVRADQQATAASRRPFLSESTHRRRRVPGRRRAAVRRYRATTREKRRWRGILLDDTWARGLGRHGAETEQTVVSAWRGNGGWSTSVPERAAWRVPQR